MQETAIDIVGVSKRYRSVGGYFGGRSIQVQALRDVTLRIGKGEVFGLVGESGSGKSTLARLIVGLEKPSAGHISVMGKQLNHCSAKERRELRKEIQIVFQDAYGALDPLMTIGRSVEEPLINLTTLDKRARQDRIRRVFNDVELPDRMLGAYPHQLSGGERQRACIARAIISNPRVVVCDEPVSSLDKSIQMQIVNLFMELKNKHELTYIFISHDMAVVNQLCSRVAVMYQGHVVELGDRDTVLFNPEHPYTQSLMRSAEYFMAKLPPKFL